jgi:hypothetical protein
MDFWHRHRKLKFGVSQGKDEEAFIQIVILLTKLVDSLCLMKYNLMAEKLDSKEKA